MLSAKTFCAALQFARHASAVKDVRTYLNGVFLEFKAPNSLTVVALDVYRLAVVELAADEHDLDASFILPSVEVVKLLALYKKSAAKLVFSVADRGALGVSDGAGSATFPIAEGHFPDWRRVLPAGEPTATPGFWNPDYLADLSMAAASLQKGASYPSVEIKHYAGVDGRAGLFGLQLTRSAHPEVTAAYGYVMGINP